MTIGRAGPAAHCGAGCTLDYLPVEGVIPSAVSITPCVLFGRELPQ